MRVPVDRAEAFVGALFTAVGAGPDDAAVIAARLVEGDLRGRRGHGLMRVRQYVERAQAGGIDPRAEIRRVADSPSSALIDGGNGFGPVVMTRAAETAIAKAEATGLGWVGTRNSNHAGAGGVYTALALRRGLAALYMAVAAGNVMPPWGGTERLLGTNPLAVAIPAGESPAFQLDIATTVTSHGTIRTRQLAGETLPEGWVVDQEGRPITDPAEADAGFLVPIGGYKGSGLNVMIGLLAGVMNGAAFGRQVVGRDDPLSTPTNTGQTILVFRPDLFMPLDAFRASIDRHLSELRSSATADGSPVRLPGEFAHEVEVEQRRLGLEVPDALVADLNALAGDLGVGALA